MTFIHRHPKLTSRPVTEFSTDFHFCCQGDDGDPYFVSDAGLEGLVDISRVAGGKRTKDDKYLSRGVRGEVAACLI